MSALKILSETSFSYSFCSFYWIYCFSNLSWVDDMGVLRKRTTTFQLVFRHSRRTLKWRSLKLPMTSMLLILRSTALPRLVLPTPTSLTRIFCLSFPVFLRFFKSSLLQRGVTCFSVESLKFVSLIYLQYGDLFRHVYMRQFWQ